MGLLTDKSAKIFNIFKYLHYSGMLNTLFSTRSILGFWAYWFCLSIPATYAKLRKLVCWTTPNSQLPTLKAWLLVEWLESLQKFKSFISPGVNSSLHRPIF